SASANADMPFQGRVRTVFVGSGIRSRPISTIRQWRSPRKLGIIKPRPTKRCAGIGKAAKTASKSPQRGTRWRRSDLIRPERALKGVQMRHARVFLVEDEALI